MSNAMIYVPGEVLTVVVENKPYTIAATHPNFKLCVQAAKEGRFADIPELANVALAVKKFTDGKIDVDTDNGVVRFGGEAIHNHACDRLLQLMEAGHDVDPLVAFLQNLMQNPSKRAVDELYGFLEYAKMPITEDGCFIAYKRVRRDYKSVHDGKTDNSVGVRVEMERNKVDDRSDVTCSYGLHFCSHEYLSQFSGEKVVILKINPRDVVSIPTDYNNTKGRAAGYDVIGELSDEEVDRAVAGRMFEDTALFGHDVAESMDWDDRDMTAEEAEEQYQDGYTNGFDEAQNGDEQEYIVSNGTPYQDGYVDGWNKFQSDGDDGVTTPSQETFRAGYVDGYDDGRARSTPDDVETSDYSNGYQEGYADGRGHKAKRFF